MGKKMSGSNSTGPTKAGKKHQFKEPAAPNADNRARSLAGEQQFIRDKGRSIDSLPSTFDNPFVELAKAFGIAPKGRKHLDTGYRFDTPRGRVVVPENEFTNGY